MNVGGWSCSFEIAEWNGLFLWGYMPGTGLTTNRNQQPLAWSLEVLRKTGPAGILKLLKKCFRLNEIIHGSSSCVFCVILQQEFPPPPSYCRSSYALGKPIVYNPCNYCQVCIPDPRNLTSWYDMPVCLEFYLYIIYVVFIHVYVHKPNWLLYWWIGFRFQIIQKTLGPVQGF